MERRRKRETSHHVADQPGFGHAIRLIGFAVFLGLLLRTVLASEAIAEKIRDAASHINKDLTVQFDQARISLADGLLPEFAVIVERVRFDSTNPCWLSPKGEIDAIRLPLDFWQVVRGRITVSQVAVGNVDVQLRARPDECQKNTAHSQPFVPVRNQARSSEQETLFQTESRGPINHVSFNSVRIQPQNLASTTVDIDSLRVDKQGDQFHLSGHLNLGGLTFSGDFSSHARFELDYSETQTVLAISGSWREGKYTLKAQADQKTRTYECQGQIQHLPLSQIFSLLKKYQVPVGEFDGRQVWLNLEFSSNGPQSFGAVPMVRVDKLNVEGDLGSIDGGHFVISKWAPLELSDTSFYLRGFKLEKVFSLLGREKKPQSLGSLGEINGVFRSLGAQHYDLSGEFSGFELVFSNRGERRKQMISLMTVHLDYEAGKWSLLLDKIRPHEGLMLGQVKLSGVEGRQDVDVDVKVEEMHLGPEVQALMTGGGSLGRWSVDLKGTLDKRGLKKMKGQIFAQELMVEGLEMPRMKANLQTNGEKLIVDLTAPRVAVHSGSRVRGVLEPLLAPFAATSALDSLSAKDVSLSMNFVPHQDLHWKARPLHFADLLLKTEGAWDRDGNLDGKVVVTRKSEERQWKIRGHRDEAIFEPTGAAKPSPVANPENHEASQIW